MVKLQKEVSRKYKNKIYYKYTFCIPNEIIKKLKIFGGDEFQVLEKNNKEIVFRM
jgi:hypothetical protein